MRITFIGSGSAFTLNNYQSNILLELDVDTNGMNHVDRLLLDCGTDARFALRDMNLNAGHIDSIYISHTHADHIGGLEWYAFSRKFSDLPLPKLYISQYFENALWFSLAPGLQSITGQTANLHTYFDVTSIAANGVFTWRGIEFKLIQVPHIFDGFNSYPSFGLFFEVNGKKIYITTDMQFNFQKPFKPYEYADIIFQDCETAQKPSGVHAHFNQLKTLPPEIKEKMWLYHYGMEKLPNAINDGFKGFVKKGQAFIM